MEGIKKIFLNYSQEKYLIFWIASCLTMTETIKTTMKNNHLFLHILANSAISGFTNMLIWFAITFWVFLETRSVFVTGMLGGIYLVLNLFGGIWF